MFVFSYTYKTYQLRPSHLIPYISKKQNKQHNWCPHPTGEFSCIEAPIPLGSKMEHMSPTPLGTNEWVKDMHPLYIKHPRPPQPPLCISALHSTNRWCGVFSTS